MSDVRAAVKVPTPRTVTNLSDIINVQFTALELWLVGSEADQEEMSNSLFNIW